MQRQPVYLSSALRDMGKSMGETMARSNKPPTARPNDLGGGGQPNYNPARTNDIGYGRTQKSVSGATGMSVNEAAEAAASVAEAKATAGEDPRYANMAPAQRAAGNHYTGGK